MGTTRTPARARLGGLIGLLALALTTLLGAGIAAAEPPYATEATITSVDFAAEEVQSGSNARIDVTWALEDNAETPAGFVIDLPDELQGRTTSFPLTDAQGTTMGQCDVTGTQVVCDLDSDYLADNPIDVGGSLNFWVKVTTEVTETTETTYDIDGVDATVTVNPAAGSCEDCTFDGRSNYKWGSYQTDGDWIAWGVSVKAPVDGMAEGQSVTVSDRPGGNLEITRAYLVATNQKRADGSGLTGWAEVPADQYTVSEDLTTVSFTASEGYFYEVRYDTATTDAGASAEYSNEADVVIDGSRTVTVRRTVESMGSGGTGSGTNVGTFTITKQVTGDVDAVAGVTFTGTYAVTTPAGEVLEGTFEVTDGQTWTSDQFPRGSTVHLTEVTPTEPANVTWAEPEFSENDFTLAGGATVAVTLTNDATEEPTEPTTEPTEPTTEPTEPTTEPTDPTTEPTEPTTDATTEPTEEFPTAISPATATRTLEPTESTTGSTGPALASTGADRSGTALFGALALMTAGGLLLVLRRRRALR